MSDLKSWNPWHGCRKYSEGCEHCYMFALDRIREVPERSAVIARTQAMRKPLARDRHGNYKIPPGYCLRVNMTSDTFIEEADALMTRRYHAGKCSTCTMLDLCIGCVDCGNCKNVRLVGREEIYSIRKRFNGRKK